MTMIEEKLLAAAACILFYSFLFLQTNFLVKDLLREILGPKAFYDGQRKLYISSNFYL